MTAVHTLRCDTCRHEISARNSHHDTDEASLTDNVVALFNAAHSGHDTSRGEES